tara:strand:+ start:392 stop:547 length:156 start_codon:yes stop_codon:yes gene_type:complete
MIIDYYHICKDKISEVSNWLSVGIQGALERGASGSEGLISQYRWAKRGERA